MSVNQHYYDIEVYETGTIAYFMWRTNTIRIPILSSIKDTYSRFKRKSSNKASKVQENVINIKWKDVQGIVKYDLHKEIMIRTNKDLITILFRKPKEYDKFIDHLQEYLIDKIFTRDEEKLPLSIYEGNTWKKGKDIALR